MKVSLGGIEATLTQSGEQDHVGSFSASRVTITREDDVATLEPIVAEVWVGGDGLLATEQIVFSELRMASDDIDLDVSGTVDLPLPSGFGHARTGLAVDVDVSGSASLTTLGAAGEIPLHLAGHSFGAAHITLREGQPLTVDGDGDVNDLVVDRMRLGTLHTRFHADETALALSDARWAIGDTVVRGSARAQLVEGVPYEIDAIGERLSAYGDGKHFPNLH